jgi:hypothetical protein
MNFAMCEMPLPTPGRFAFDLTIKGLDWTAS